MANKANSLSHTKWVCKYHIVFTPKYRRKIIYNQYKESVRDILKQLCAYKGVIDQIVDWFGTDIRMTELNEKQVEVSVKASPNAMEHWAMQYINYVEITKPVELRERIKKNLASATERYE